MPPMTRQPRFFSSKEELHLAADAQEIAAAYFESRWAAGWMPTFFFLLCVFVQVCVYMSECRGSDGLLREWED